MIEDLMLMESGKLTYFGTTKNARSFFDSLAGECPSSVNPAGAGFSGFQLMGVPPNIRGTSHVPIKGRFVLYKWWRERRGPQHGRSCRALRGVSLHTIREV